MPRARTATWKSQELYLKHFNILSSNEKAQNSHFPVQTLEQKVAGQDCLRHILERQLAVRAEDSDDDDDPDRTYAFPPPVDLDAYAAACRLPPAEETEDEREARFQRERYYGL